LALVPPEINLETTPLREEVHELKKELNSAYCLIDELKKLN
jgi:hypothetical protein